MPTSHNVSPLQLPVRDGCLTEPKLCIFSNPGEASTKFMSQTETNILIELLSEQDPIKKKKKQKAKLQQFDLNAYS